MDEKETEVGPDGNTYAVCRCIKCNVVCHGMSGSYLEYQMCPKCAPKE